MTKEKIIASIFIIATLLTGKSLSYEVSEVATDPIMTSPSYESPMQPMTDPIMT